LGPDADNVTGPPLRQGARARIVALSIVLRQAELLGTANPNRAGFGFVKERVAGRHSHLLEQRPRQRRGIAHATLPAASAARNFEILDVLFGRALSEFVESTDARNSQSTARESSLHSSQFEKEPLALGARGFYVNKAVVHPPTRWLIRTSGLTLHPDPVRLGSPSSNPQLT